MAGARGIDGATEGVVAEFLEIVGQEVVGPYADVEGEVAQFVMVHAASDDAGMSITVVDDVIVEDDMVGDERHGIVNHGIVGVQALHEEIAIGHHLSLEVDCIEWSEQAELTNNTDVDVAHETFRESLQEIQGGAMWQDVEFDFFVFERDVSLYVGGFSMPVDGMAIQFDEVVIEVHGEVHLTDTAICELEVINHQVGLCLRLVEDRGDITVACYLSSEIHARHIDDVGDKLSVEMVHIHIDGVVLAIGHRS